MLTKKQVEIILSRLNSNSNPKPLLEQYEIQGRLAAEIINLAFLSQNITGKSLLDLGCGSGRLAIGSALIGAKKVIGIDIDGDVLKIAKKMLKWQKICLEKELKIR